VYVWAVFEISTHEDDGSDCKTLEGLYTTRALAEIAATPRREENAEVWADLKMQVTVEQVEVIDGTPKAVQSRR
jgi:hypothetical protein